MSKYEIMPTDENLIKEIQLNSLRRNEDLECFCRLLSTRKKATTISIEGNWGCGKTFFVKQLFLIINAYNKQNNFDKKKRYDINSFFDNYHQSDLDSQFAIYYDAWKNDNDSDPLASIIYEMAQQLDLLYEFKDTNLINGAIEILDFLSKTRINDFIKALKNTNSVNEIEKEKSFEERIKEFISNAINERGNRMVLFIDELDRCKPTYAVKLLEEIKHYLFDDRITIIFSVNSEELQHTIKHFYGNDFDALRYLDKFFDYRFSLPKISMDLFYQRIGFDENSMCAIVTQKFINKYKLEIREAIRYIEHVEIVTNGLEAHYSVGMVNRDGAVKRFLLSTIIPIGLGLRGINSGLYNDFISGKDYSLLAVIYEDDVFAYMFYDLLSTNETFNEGEGKKQISLEMVMKKVYDAIFINAYSQENPSVRIGKYLFTSSAKEYVLSALSMIFDDANYSI